MTAKQIVPGLYQVSLGIVNAFLLQDGEAITVIDAGVPDSATDILDAVDQLGAQATAVQRILVTHLHADHTGSLAALKRATGAPAAMHPLDAALVRRGEAARPSQPAPGLINNLLYRVMSLRGSMEIEPAEIEEEIEDGAELDVAGGLRVIGVPGHAAGQVAFFWPQHGGVLFAADAASNMFFGLGYPPIFEDLAAGKESLRKLAGMEFDVACFGHGEALVGGASARFREKWG
jgi:glyoxylase-like metal-dependent hydrolase (beta-lactamase superfamily II)